MQLVTWAQSHWTLILSVLFGFSETLSLIPAIKANGVFQLLFGILSKLKPS